MMDIIKVQKGTNKNGKEYYMITLVIHGELITTFIYKNQYEAIISRMEIEGQSHKIVIK